MLAIGLLSPRPEIPFVGLRFEEICTSVREFRSPRWNHTNGGYYGSHPCDLKTAVANVVDNIADTVTGCDLQTLKARDTKPT